MIPRLIEHAERLDREVVPFFYVLRPQRFLAANLSTTQRLWLIDWTCDLTVRCSPQGSSNSGSTRIKPGFLLDRYFGKWTQNATHIRGENALHFCARLLSMCPSLLSYPVRLKGYNRGLLARLHAPMTPLRKAPPDASPPPLRMSSSSAAASSGLARATILRLSQDIVLLERAKLTMARLASAAWSSLRTSAT